MNATWRDASFRGARFYVESYGVSGGRRGPNHEFPMKDEGYPEDTGGRMGEYEIAAYVAKTIRDPEYSARLNALIEALKKKGPGELVHPEFGTINVQIRSWSANGSKSALGMVPVRIEAVEASQPQFPMAQRNAAAGMPGLGMSAHRAAAGAFSDIFSVSGRSDFLFDSAVRSFSRVAELFASVSSLSGVPMDVAAILDTVDSALAATMRKEDETLPLAEAVAAFPRAITGHFEERHKATRNADGTYRGTASLRGNGPLEPEAAMALFRAFDFVSDIATPYIDTETRRAQYDNAEAIAALTRRTSVIEAARVAPFINWRTLQDAETARDRITDALEREAWETDSDQLYDALTAMRTLVMATIAPDDGKLPRLVDYVPAVTMPSLYLSHSLYGTATRADELAVVNGLRHPGFFPGGETIRIVSNA